MIENKIEVGEYIRTDKGTIAKIEDEEFDIKYRISTGQPLYLNMKNDRNHCFENILKHSKNIIDLIEVGYYVNGYKVIDKDDINTGCMCEIYLLEDDGIYGIWDENIKSIVTKEMFESVEYRVGE